MDCESAYTAVNCQYLYVQQNIRTICSLLLCVFRLPRNSSTTLPFVNLRNLQSRKLKNDISLCTILARRIANTLLISVTGMFNFKFPTLILVDSILPNCRSYSCNLSIYHHQFIIEDNHLTIILLLYIIYYIRI